MKRVRWGTHGTRPAPSLIQVASCVAHRVPMQTWSITHPDAGGDLFAFCYPCVLEAGMNDDVNGVVAMLCGGFLRAPAELDRTIVYQAFPRAA